MSNYLTDEELLNIVKTIPALQTAEAEWLHGMRAAIAAYLAKHGEVVGWRSWSDKHGYGLWTSLENAEAHCAHDAEPEPLYTAPQPTPQERQDAARLDWTISQLREEFERQHQGKLGSTRIEGGEYLSPALQLQWDSFLRGHRLNAAPGAEALEAQRYRWLRDNSTVICEDSRWSLAIPGPYNNGDEDASLDAAIDGAIAAMSKEPGHE